MTSARATLFVHAPRGVQGGGADPLEAKRSRLDATLGGLGRTLVAYSGGVDSTVLLAETHRVLGDRVRGVIAESPSLPRAELEAAARLARARGIPIRIIQTRELELASYRANGPDRCFHCKRELFERLSEIAGAEGWDTLAYGAVVDDLGEVRPGMRAADRFRVRAPLLECGFQKVEVRCLARLLKLPVWDKPQSACLASRIPHGQPVTAEKLAQIEASEAWLRAEFGVKIVRVRHDGALARIEVAPAEISRISTPDAFRDILLKFNGLGFGSVEIDPAGYRRADPMPGP